MSKLIRIEYCGMEGHGATLKAAKEDAARKLTAAMHGPYCPCVVSYRGYAVLIYREPLGWQTHIIAEPSGFRHGDLWGNGSYPTKQEAVRAVIANLAQLGWRYEDGETAPSIIPATNRAAIADFRTWARFQIRYRAARNAGFADSECHAYGCNAGFHAELVARIDAAIATQQQQLASLGTIVAST